MRQLLFIILSSNNIQDDINAFLCDWLPAENLGDAAIGDLEYAGYVAGAGAAVRQLHDLLPRRVGQRPPVHVDAPQLIHAAVPWNVKVWLQ